MNVAPTELVFGPQAWLVSPHGTDSVLWYIPIANQPGGRYLCDNFSHATIKDANGTSIVTEGSVVQAALGVNQKDATWTDGCLGPGDQGWMISYVETIPPSDVFTPAAALEINMADPAEPGGFRRPEAVVLPTRYQEIGNFIEVTVKNFGCQPVKLGPASGQLVLMDDAGPLFFDYLNPVNTSVLAAGEEIKLRGSPLDDPDNPIRKGRSTRARIWLSPTSPAAR